MYLKFIPLLGGRRLCAGAIAADSNNIDGGLHREGRLALTACSTNRAGNMAAYLLVLIERLFNA